MYTLWLHLRSQTLCGTHHPTNSLSVAAASRSGSWAKFLLEKELYSVNFKNRSLALRLESASWMYRPPAPTCCCGVDPGLLSFPIFHSKHRHPALQLAMASNLQVCRPLPVHTVGWRTFNGATSRFVTLWHHMRLSPEEVRFPRSTSVSIHSPLNLSAVTHKRSPYSQI